MKAITKYWFLEGFDLFEKLGRRDIMQISEVVEIDYYVDKGKCIDPREEHRGNVCFLKKGSVKIVDTKSNAIKHIVKKGNVFGELALFDGEAASIEVAYALEDCLVCHITSEQMEVLMEKHTSLKNGLLKVYGMRIQKLERRLRDLLFKDSTTRIEEFILDYIEEFNESDNSNRMVARNLLSHKDIACLTNTSRQTVSNVLSIMRKEGRVDYDSSFMSRSKENKN